MRESRASRWGYLLTALIALGASAPARAENKDNGTVETIRLIERTRGPDDVVLLDNGAPGPSIGDRLVYSSELFNPRNQRVGRTGADCVVVRIDKSAPPAEQQTVQCLISAELPDGELTVQGLGQGLENVFAITGGTGAYRTARGQVRAVDRIPLVEAEITIQLQR